MCVARWLAVVGGCRQCRGRAGLSTSAAGGAAPAVHCSPPPQCLSGSSRDTRMSVVAMTPLILQIVHFKIMEIT